MNKRFALKVQVQVNEMVSHGVDPTGKIIHLDVASFSAKHLQPAWAFRATQVASRCGFNAHTYRQTGVSAMPTS
jgi:hypothetical protein